MEESEYIAKLKIKEIFFEDMTFGLPRANVEKFCNEIKKRNLKLSWTCFSRVDVADYGLLSLMKEAGCHTVIFAVESGNDMILEKYNKDIDKNKTIAAFKNCRKLGLKTVATFILGLPVVTIQHPMNVSCELIKDCENCFLSNLIPQDLSGKISLLLSNDELRNTLSAAARNSIRKYGWNTIAGQNEEFYQHILAKNR